MPLDEPGGACNPSRMANHQARRFRFEPVSLIVALLVSLAVSYFAGLSFWIVLPVIVAAMLLHGLAVDAEDDAPGGFLNPIPPGKDADGQKKQDRE